MKKKLCLLIPSLGGGGAERVAFNLLNNLDLKSFELYLIIVYKKKGNYLKNLRKNIKIVFLEKDNIRYSLFGIYRNLKKIKPDIVLVFSFDLMIIIGLFIIPFFKNIYFINRQLNIISKLKFGKIKKFLLKKAIINFDKIITQSSDMTKDLINFMKSDKKIVEINNPVDISTIKILMEEEINIELNKKDKNLLCVGRLEKQKGFDLIIKIMRLFKNENIKLYILGEGSQRSFLEKLIKIYKLENKVFLIGRKENPYVYMKNADLFILSSRYEGFPNVLLEANACGLYAICNNSLGGINEIVIENINGNIIDFKNEDLVKETIEKKLIKNNTKKLIQKNISERYDAKIIIQKYTDLLLNNTEG